VEQVVFPQILLANQFSDEMIVELTQLLHVCCGLKIQVHLYLTNEESSALLNLITCTCPPFSSAGVRFIQVGLCLLLSCPFLINSTEGESAVVRWLNWILSNLPQFESVLSPVGGSGYGEMLLLIIIHLQEKQTKQIEKLVSSVLEMKLTTPLASSNHFLSLKDLFLQVFKENVVCSHAVSVPPTPSLSGHMTGYLPIHCIHQLMRSKAFRKHGVLVNQWIYNQIMSTAEPLHPSLPPLIEEFVMALLVNPIPPAKSNHSAVLQVPFTADEVLNVFIQSEDTPTDHTYSISSQMLMLYYILYYQDTYLIHLKTLLATSNRGTIKCYGPNVLLHLPIKRLLHHASIHQVTSNMSTLADYDYEHKYILISLERNREMYYLDYLTFGLHLPHIEIAFT
jgi:integrator complex subunit 2